MNRNNFDQTTSYADLAGKTYTVIVEAVSEANHRALAFGKAWFDVLTKPYASGAIEDTYRENFARANTLVDLGVKELQSAGSHAAKVGGSLTHLGSELQEVMTQSFRGVLQMGASNVNFATSTVEQTINGATKRAQEYTSSTTPVVAGSMKKN